MKKRLDVPIRALKTHFLQVLAAVSNMEEKQGFRLFRQVIVLKNQRRIGTTGITIYRHVLFDLSLVHAYDPSYVSCVL